jgi:hypothetical protein
MWQELLRGTGAKPVPFFAKAAGVNKLSGAAELGPYLNDAQFTQLFAQITVAGSLSTLVTIT